MMNMPSSSCFPNCAPAPGRNAVCGFDSTGRTFRVLFGYALLYIRLEKCRPAELAGRLPVVRSCVSDSFVSSAAAYGHGFAADHADTAQKVCYTYSHQGSANLPQQAKQFSCTCLIQLAVN